MKFRFWEKPDYRRKVDIEIEDIKRRLLQLPEADQKEIAAALLKIAFPACHISRNPRKGSN